MRLGQLGFLASLFSLGLVLEACGGNDDGAPSEDTSTGSIGNSGGSGGTSHSTGGSGGNPVSGGGGNAGGEPSTLPPRFPEGTPPETAVPVLSIPAKGAPSVIEIDLAQKFGPLKKAGLGTLFGITTMPDTPANLAAQTQVTLSQHMMTSVNSNEPAGTEAVLSKLEGSDIKMVARLNDLMGGNPWYQWSNLTEWIARVKEATQRIQPYKARLYAVAPFNEPDNKLHGLENDVTIPGANYDAKFNSLWTETVKAIRSIDATVPIMGPNYEFYLPWVAGQQQKMKDFLKNAVTTGTSPNLIGWHNLGPSPGDVPEALKYYRPLEEELKVPGRPLKVVVEEYGPQTTAPSETPGNFEGVAGTMVKYWADFERCGIDFGSMGVYTTPGLLGNTLRRDEAGEMHPNAGFWMMKWYKGMTGERVFVSRWDTRKYLGADAVASYDAPSGVVTVLLGGEDGPIDVSLKGLASVGFGTTAHVVVECVPWNKDENEVEKRVDQGGDALAGSLLVYETNIPIASGAVTIPVRRIGKYHGYRVLLAKGTAIPDSKRTPDAERVLHYEAEDALVNNAKIYADASTWGQKAWQATGSAYVGGIDHPDSSVNFEVNVEKAGLYVLSIRYANGTGGTSSHFLAVNGQWQGGVFYPVTPNGWSASELGFVERLVRLDEGTNFLHFQKGAGFAELDAIHLRVDTHRYEAEDFVVNDAKLANFWGGYIPDYVGHLDNPTSEVVFSVEVPKAGTYDLVVGYGNGTNGDSTHSLLVNGAVQSTVTYPKTTGWLGGPTQDHAGGTVTSEVDLLEGKNEIVLRKDASYAELDFIRIK